MNPRLEELEDRKLLSAYVFQTIDDPLGVNGTRVLGVNDTGQVVGYYYSSSGNYLGFLRSADGSTFTTIDPPAGAQDTDARGINNAGQVVGSYDNWDIDIDSYLRSADGSNYTTFSDPVGSNTEADGINDTGQIVGDYHDSSGSDHGFLRSADGSTYTTIDVPGDTIDSVAYGINDAGQIVGDYYDSSLNAHGFLRSADGSAYTTIDDPFGVNGTNARGINAAGQIVGIYGDSSGIEHGFLRSADGSTYATLDDPLGVGGSYALGINSAGQVVGFYVDSSGQDHGFIATPDTVSGLVVTTQPPQIAGLDDTFDVQVSAEDANGNVDTSFDGPVTMALDNNPGGATLGGTLTVNAVNGVADFPDLTLNEAGTGYTLQATSTGLTSVDTGSFTVAYTPDQIRAAYGIDGLPWDGTGQTIAIVDAYDDPNLQGDLQQFDAEFGINDPPSFTELNEYGGTTLPGTDPSQPPYDWEAETVMDVEWAHAIAPGAGVDVIECNSPSSDDLDQGVTTAEGLPGVSVVSMSWGSSEDSSETSEDSLFTAPGVTFLASTGDYGSPGAYPAYSPAVVAVGGTTLTLNADGSYSETGWSLGSDTVLGYPNAASGGGPSQVELQPAYQQGVVPASMSTIQGVAYRTTPDVSFDADPLTGAAVYDSYNDSAPADPWDVGGGTSLSAPCWAGLIALVNEGRVVSGEQTLNSSNPIQTLGALDDHATTGDFNDITSGYNGYYAASGYDMVTGLGSPVANELVPDLINTDNTAMTLTSSPDTSVFGQPVTFTATVQPVPAVSQTPTGTVTFYDGTKVLGQGVLDQNGTAALTTSVLSGGSHTIAAIYGGDTNFLISIATTPQIVNQQATTTAVTSSHNPSVFGQSVTFTATVSATDPQSGTPTGTVTFYDGTTELGTGTVGSSGRVTLSTKSLPVGSYAITADYSGDTDFMTSTSTTLLQFVVQDRTITLLASSPDPSVFGQAVTFTATVSAAAPGSGTPTGTVTFMDGLTPIGRATLNNGRATLKTSALGAGTQFIIALYSGDGNFLASAAAPLKQTVKQDGTTTSIKSSANPSVVGQKVTFTATVTASAPGSGTPTGKVTFWDGSKILGSGTLSGGIASYVTSMLSAGTHLITAVYSGDIDFKTSTSPVLDQRVNHATSGGPPVSTPNAVDQVLGTLDEQDQASHGSAVDDLAAALISAPILHRPKLASVRLARAAM